MMCRGLSVRVYIPGRARTGSSPFRTLMDCSSYFMDPILLLVLDFERHEEARDHVVRGDGGGELHDLARGEAVAQLAEERLRHLHIAGHGERITHGEPLVVGERRIGGR